MAELGRALDAAVRAARVVDEDEAPTRYVTPRPVAIEPPTELTVPRPPRPTPRPEPRPDPIVRAPTAAPAFDMNRIETREAWVRRIVWILVAVIVAVGIYVVRSI
jgi:hypothetical protein